MKKKREFSCGGELACGWLALVPSGCGRLEIPWVSQLEKGEHRCSSVHMIRVWAYARFAVYFTVRCCGNVCVLHGCFCNCLYFVRDGTQTQTRTRTKTPFAAAKKRIQYLH